MKKSSVFSVVTLALAACACSLSAAEVTPKTAKSPLDFKMKSLAGKEVNLDKYRGKVVLIVNVASKCGLTPQYEQLQALYEKYGDKGFVILGFPCNQFGKQEPGTPKEIQTFCSENYGVTFDLFSKVDVNGSDACDLYQYLTALDAKPKGKGKISWNFEKFLVGRDGQVVARYSPPTKPDEASVISEIETQLAKK